MVMIKVMSSWWSPAAAVLLWRRLRGTANSGDPSFLRSGHRTKSYRDVQNWTPNAGCYELPISQNSTEPTDAIPVLRLLDSCLLM
uniref:Secreted protein n=1 Tax=Oryza glumipatula TaxID=40148 RepID=A0A0D9YMQ5_9ORYZ